MPETTPASPYRTPDSPRWCERCQAWGDHHTDRHPAPENDHSKKPADG